MIDIKISDKAIEPKLAEDFVLNAAAGGSVVFIGAVRNQTQGKKVMAYDNRSDLNALGRWVK
mgnify:CR=1 FL=1